MKSFEGQRVTEQYQQPMTEEEVQVLRNHLKTSLYVVLFVSICLGACIVFYASPFSLTQVLVLILVVACTYWLLTSKSYLLFLCLSVCTLSACKKEDPLPAATQSGANTFGCKINGKTWIPDGGGGFSGIKPIEGGIGSSPVNPSIYNVLIRTYRSDQTKLDLYIYNVKGPGKYNLNSKVMIWPAQTEPLKNYAAYFPNPSDAYVTNADYTGSITITRADTINRIVSGTFEFTVYDTSPSRKQTIRITEGRFDFAQKKQ